MDKKKKRVIIIGLLAVLSVFIMKVSFDKQSPLHADPVKNKAIEASSIYPLLEKDWSVKYHVKKQRIYFENIIPRFSFQGSVSQLPNHMDGYIAVFMNGKWIMNANQSIFILKNISKGKHEITLQLKRRDGSDYGIKKNIFVHVR